MNPAPDLTPTPQQPPATLWGRLKIMAGPVAFRLLIDADLEPFDVSVGPAGLSWSSKDGASCLLRGGDIDRVEQHGRTFVVERGPIGYGVKVLTFQAGTSEVARQWVEAINAVREAGAEPAVPAVGPEPSAAGVAERPVRVTYSRRQTGEITTGNYAALVIACDPRNLIGVCDYTDAELADFARLKNLTFHMNLLEVTLEPGVNTYEGVFDPTTLDLLDGDVHAFRNESIKQFGAAAAGTLPANLVVTYQLTCGDQDAAYFDQRLPTLANAKWWPYGSDFRVLHSVTTPYFAQFSAEDLSGGAPWRLLDRQGERHTLLVHASTCFESVLHCWAYGNMIISDVAGAARSLPADRGAPIVVIGAGVSGLLFAARLRQAGFTDIEILETTGGPTSDALEFGKTHTLRLDGYTPDGCTGPTTCELGTCFLSPAYAPMVEALGSYFDDNHQRPLTSRGVATEGQFPTDRPVPEVLPYDDYVTQKAEVALGIRNNVFDRIGTDITLAYDLAKYGVLHPCYVGFDPPMPRQPPEALSGTFGQQTFQEYLQHHGLWAMAGSMQYGYEAQGYGRIRTIPAYYGLVWITPAITWRVLATELHLDDVHDTTDLTLGWGEVWHRLVQQNSLAPRFGVEVSEVVRG